jgi:hypothetical protein
MRCVYRLAAALVALPVLTMCGGSSSSGTSQPGPVGPDSVVPGHDWRTFGWDVGRSSASTAPSPITASNVGSMRRQQVKLEGTVDASAIYLSDVQVNGTAHDVFIVTTTYGKTIAVNANTGVILWTYTPSGYSSWAGSSQVTTATPVADPDRQFVYAASPNGQVQKISVANGSSVWSTAITQLPQREKVGSPLAYFAGRIIAVVGGYDGDTPQYQGHVAILDAGSGQLTHVWNALCSDQLALIMPSQCAQSGAAIWGRAGAVVDSSTGDIYVATGNGLWDGAKNWGDAILRLDSSATHLLGNFTPTNTATLAADDADLGSTSPAILGGGYVAQGGKDGQIRLLTISGMAGASPHMDGEVESVSTPSGSGLFTALAVLQSSGGTSLFAADNGATSAWTLSGGHLTNGWHNGNAGTSPVVAGGLVYVYDPGGALRVYQATSGALVATLSCGSGHWNSPIVIDGKIALPEGSANDHQMSGTLDIWRLP